MSADKQFAVPEVPKKYSYHANSRMDIRLVSSTEEMESGEKNQEHSAFHPEYAHVFFGDDEIIDGYHEPRVHLTFSAASFRSLVRFDYEEKKPLVPCTPVVDNVVQYLAPGSWTKAEDEFADRLEQEAKEFRPFGEPVCEYEVRKREGEEESAEEVRFQVYWAQFYSKEKDAFDEELIAWHERMQPFIMMEIDGGTYIEARDPRWELYGLYEQRTLPGGEQRYRCVGYCTAYRFYSLMHSFRLRISQFLLLTPYRKRGHGRRLLQAIYQHARARGVRDIPVEDPAPEFMRLRDMVDMGILLKANVFTPDMTELTAELTDKIVTEHRLWKKQIRRCFEIYRLRHVRRSDESQYKPYRLYVKRRLLNTSREHLEAFEEGNARKLELHRLYMDLEGQYDAIIGKLGRQGL